MGIGTRGGDEVPCSLAVNDTEGLLEKPKDEWGEG